MLQDRFDRFEAWLA